jgi:hypothetical protein
MSLLMLLCRHYVIIIMSLLMLLLPSLGYHYVINYVILVPLCYYSVFNHVIIVVIMSSNRNITGGFDKPAHVESTVFDKSVSPLRR